VWTDRTALALVASTVLLQACIVVPRTVTTQEPDCAVLSRRVELEAVAIENLGHCRNNAECSGLLVVAGVTAVASAVVSGSIAIVGNIVYWTERKGQCLRGG
jgi:hypothetical protein